MASARVKPPAPDAFHPGTPSEELANLLAPSIMLEKEHGRQILSVVGAKLLMGVSPFEAKRMQGPFELSEYYVDMLTQLGHGEGLLQLSNAMLKVWIRIPQDLGVF